MTAEKDAPARRVALVTGSSRGIGRAILMRLSVDHDCVVHYRRNDSAAEEVSAALRSRNVRHIVHRADLGETAETMELLRRIQSEYGRLDTVVASAAASKFAPVLSLQPHHVERTMNSVVSSFVMLARGLAELSPSEQPESGGRLISIGGLDARFAQSGHGLLGAAKASLEALTRSLAVELAPLGATANVIVPGAITSDSLDAYFRDSPDAPSDARQAMVSGTPLQRLGTPEDVAEFVAFIASPAARYITGQVLTVDGGASAEGGAWSQFRTLWEQERARI
jgi:enoyl-[acyl-carrier protein] reductase III